MVKIWWQFVTIISQMSEQKMEDVDKTLQIAECSQNYKSWRNMEFKNPPISIF